MTNYLAYSLTTDESDASNSLEGIVNYADQEIALVQLSNRYFRFFAASTETPDGVRVIAPANITPPAAGRWIIQGRPGPLGNTLFRRNATNSNSLKGFDFFINSRDDLVRAVGEPVGGVFTLLDGAYAQGADITLNAGERLDVPSGTDVFWMGFGPDVAIIMTPTTAAGLTVNGEVTLLNTSLLINGNGNTGIAILATANVRVTGGNLTMTGTGTTGLTLAGGTLHRFTDWVMGIGGAPDTGISISGGRVKLTACRIESDAVTLTGGAANCLRAVNTTFRSLGGTVFNPNVANSSWVFGSCLFEGVGVICNLEGCARIDVSNCKIEGNGTGAGILIDGNISEALKVTGGSFADLSNAVQYTSGTVDLCALANVDSLADVIGSFIAWAAASIPTDGLLVTGCRHAGAGAFNLAHTPADARVNYKANSHDGALVTETAIVP